MTAVQIPFDLWLWSHCT